jgi:DNA polymerase III epsilon subunit-like protein
MLVFDIETMGLDARKHAVTVVSTQDFRSGRRVSYEFARTRAETPHLLAALGEEMVLAFEEASSLCAFNGVRFDLPFLRTALKIDDATITRWVLKTSDILESSRLLHNSTFSLDLLCQTNGMPTKISSGLQAIFMAAEQRWDDLREYCEDDVDILCRLYNTQHVIHPRNKKMLDLEEWAHADCYEEPA